jgi:hypothetical protein
MQLRRQGKSVFGSVLLLVACTAVSLVSPSLGAAESSSFYSSFSRCPTGAPEMNDPATEEAACFSSLVRRGAMKLGHLEMPLPVTHVQFAVAGLEGEEGFVKVVPGSTSVEAAPIFIPNPFATRPTPPPTPPTPPVQGKKHHKKKHHKKRHQKRKHHRSAKGKKHGQRNRLVAFDRAQASAADEPMIAISVEPTGDIREFNLSIAASEGGPGVAFELPLRLHLQGDGLGPNCFVGSAGDPILVAPHVVHGGTALIFGKDPNGFPIQLVGASGARLEDATLTIPGATGCGPTISASGAGLFDSKFNAFVGLPAPTGGSRMVLGDNLLEFVGAGYNGIAPDGGAELQAAFDAAR